VLAMVEEEDEIALMRAAQGAIPAEDGQQLRDFNIARYIARQSGTEAYSSSFSAAPSNLTNDATAARRSGRARNQRFPSLNHCFD
jgi:hypothetical protein